MRGAFTGLRGRVTFTVLVVTAALFSLMGTIGFVSISDNGRQSVRDRIGEVLDQLESNLRSGGGAVTLSTSDGVDAIAVMDPVTPPEVDGIVQVTRKVSLGGVDVTLIGRTSDARLTESLRSFFRALWIAIPIAAIVSAIMAGLATSRVLRPVDSITARASSIGTPTAGARVPVPDTDDEITRLALTLNSLLDRVDSAHFAQRQFTSDAAHELRTPLMALQGELELLTNGVQRADHATLERMLELSHRLGERIDDLLLLSTLDEGRPLELRERDLLPIVRDAVAEIAPRAELTGSSYRVLADDRHLARAIRNLLANALRHGNGAIRVTIDRVDNFIGLHVDDDGAGVPDEDQERIFGRFTRLDASRDSTAGGAGLGLSIVAAIVAAHGGRVTVTSGELGGARFSMWMPASNEVSPESSQRPT